MYIITYIRYTNNCQLIIEYLQTSNVDTVISIGGIPWYTTHVDPYHLEVYIAIP